MTSTNDVISQKRDMASKKYFAKSSSGLLNSCKNRRWSGKISEIEQNKVKNDVIGQKRAMLSRTGHVE